MRFQSGPAKLRAGKPPRDGADLPHAGGRFQPGAALLRGRWVGGFIAFAFLAAAVAACGIPSGGGSGGGGPASAVTAPATVAAAPSACSAPPADCSVTLTWTAPTGSVGTVTYSVYSANSASPTAGRVRVMSGISTLSQTISGLPSGAVTYFAVSATDGVGQGPLSGIVCAVPSVGAGSIPAGFALWDGLCSPTLDSSKWATAPFSRGVSNGAVLTVNAADLEPLATRGLVYESPLDMAGIGATKRATAMQVDVTIPAATASRTGTAVLRAEVGLSYEPAADRLQFPGGLMNAVYVTVYLEDTGAGLTLGREVYTCADVTCVTKTALAPASFNDLSFPVAAAASYDSTYTLGLSVDETTQIFTYQVSGGLNGLGQVNVSSLLAAGIVNDADSAFLRPRVWDPAVAGGSAGSISATFAKVKAGFNTAGAAGPAALAQYDTFSGPVPNSGADFSLFKWTTGTSGVAAGQSSVSLVNKLTSVAAANTAAIVPLAVSNGAPVTGMAADLTLTEFTPPGVASPGSDVQQLAIQMALYNTASAAPAANDSTGDIWAGVGLTNAGGFWTVYQCSDPRCLTSTSLATGSQTLPAGTVHFGVPFTHTLVMQWSPGTLTGNILIFQIDDGVLVNVDPTVLSLNIGTAAPIASATPGAPFAQIRSINQVGAVGQGASVSGTVNNVWLK